MVRLIGFAGSLRQRSFNRALIRAAAAVMPGGSSLEVLSIDAVPLYNADIEHGDGIPSVVTVLKDRLAAADGLVIATPEYNGGIPGVAKNVLDWISRPPADMARVTYGKSVALMGATPGGFGTAFAQAAWLQTLRTMRMRLWVEAGPFYVSRAPSSFDDAGRPTEELEQRLRDYMAAYVASFS
jgi:NAD(P)H-dependent FMN reductase